MITELSLENFKSFKKLENLKIKPITILCGSNSCGKSSILQSILLTKQTLESQNFNQTLLLNGKYIHLGTFDNIVYDKDKNNNISLEFKMRLNKRTPSKRQHRSISSALRNAIRDLVSENNYKDRNSSYIITYKIKLKNIESVSESIIKPILVTELMFKVECEKDNGNQTESYVVIKLSKETSNNYDIKWNLINRFERNDINNNFEGEKKDIKIKFTNLFPRIIDFMNETNDEKSEDEEFRVYIAFMRVNTIMQRIFSEYTYIGPLREEPSRRYIYEDEIVEIGIKGENAAYIYLSEKNESVESDTFFVDNDNFIKEHTTPTIEEALNSWLSKMNIKKLKAEPVNEIIRLNLDSSTDNPIRVSIADVGFGVSQVFPIVLEGLRMPRYSTLLLEQPEIHLNPNLQMQMADFFISMALSGKRLIIETHSDHIINRLVRRIVEDSEYNLNELIGIYFINQSNSGSIYEEVKVDNTKGIVNWPNGFFDQTANEQEKIIQAGLKKRQSL